MPAYKDSKQGTWYASFYFENWQGVKQKKLKRGFATKKDALAWEREFLLQQAADLTMTFEAFVEIYIHDLRHSHVSLLIEMGFSALAIADRVGHESVDITYKYAHLFPSKQQEMAQKLDMERREG